jgi:hypothetical protein
LIFQDWQLMLGIDLEGSTQYNTQSYCLRFNKHTVPPVVRICPPVNVWQLQVEQAQICPWRRFGILIRDFQNVLV